MREARGAMVEALAAGDGGRSSASVSVSVSVTSASRARDGSLSCKRAGGLQVWGRGASTRLGAAWEGVRIVRVELN
jgi:hypothetical protein